MKRITLDAVYFLYRLFCILYKKGPYFVSHCSRLLEKCSVEFSILAVEIQDKNAQLMFSTETSLLMCGKLLSFVWYLTNKRVGKILNNSFQKVINALGQ